MTWYTDDRKLYWEQRRLDAEQERAWRRLTEGYHDCCGMSRARGHYERCHKRTPPSRQEDR